MTPIDLGHGFLGGLLSFLTPEALLLFPLLLGTAAAADRRSVITVAIGLGLSLVLTGMLAVSFGKVFGADAIWLRRLVCGLLILQALLLMSETLVERFPMLTGGIGGSFGVSGVVTAGASLRQLLLALFVGANWLPRFSPALGKASLMAADSQNAAIALGVVFMFGLGAAVPWILLGRVVRLVLRPMAEGLFTGMAGKRLLGIALLVVAGLGASGYDLAMVRGLDGVLPGWTRTLTVMF